MKRRNRFGRTSGTIFHRLALENTLRSGCRRQRIGASHAYLILDKPQMSTVVEKIAFATMVMTLW